MLRDESSHLEIIPLEHSSLRRNKMKSNETHNSQKKTNNKSGKNGEKKKKKKKRSSLAFWFCMGSKTDNVDKDSKPYPAPKQKSKEKKDAKDKNDNSNKEDSRKSREKTKQDGDRRRYRHSAPPTDWINMIAALGDPGTTSGSKNEQEFSRSQSPRGSGVKYRFDGTLERPYVYPGGLTFKAGESKRKIKIRPSSKKGSKKDGNTTQAEVHQSTEDIVFYDSDDLDDSDVQRQFYLRYDSHIRKKSSRKDRRYSMPLEFQRTEPLDCMGTEYGRGESRWLDQKRAGNEQVGELFDEPYESETEENQRHLMENTHSPSSYYSPPIQFSECVYMWHSCEDLPKCDAQYHSEDEIKNSREMLPQPESKLDVHHNNTHEDKSNGTNSDQPVVHRTPSKEQLYVKSTKPSDNPFRRNLGRASCMPGNKRFFLPPPPNYTPPREDLEMVRAKMAEEEYKEDDVEKERHRFSRGSQTNLTEEWRYEVQDMADRDRGLARENEKEIGRRNKEEAPLEITAGGMMSSSNDIIKGNLGTNPNNATNQAIVSDKKDIIINSPKMSVLKHDVQPPVNDIESHARNEITEDAEYQNLPPRKSSKRVEEVVTSTPKAVRRSELSVKKPIPVPRQRFSSCLEYSTVNFTSPPMNSLQQPQQQQQHTLSKSQQEKENMAQKEAPGVVFPVSPPPTVRPVAKKRQSQQFNSDTSYTFADIEEGLSRVNDEYYSPVSSCDSNSNNTDGKSTRRALFSTDVNESVPDDDKYFSSVSNQITNSPTHVTEDDNSGSKNSINHNHRNHPNHNNNNGSKSKGERGALPPLKTLRLAKSPTDTRRRFSSVFSSSAECLTSPLAKTYYSGLSSSLADLQIHVHKDRLPRPLPFDLPHFEDDDHDDENADDEMSVYNEETPLPKTPSLENLLRARSILDRAQAVSRKRRQRMRERKCVSQILSSTEVDDFAKNHGGEIRKRHSRHSSKLKHPPKSSTTNSTTATTTTTNPPTTTSTHPTTTANTTTANTTTANTTTANTTTANTTTANTTTANTTTANTTTPHAFSFDTTPVPIQSRPALHRQNRLLNHTDSGMDSDGASPFNSRDFHHLARQNNNVSPSPAPHPLDWTPGENTSNGVSKPKGGWSEMDTLEIRKPWVGRSYQRYKLKKTSSKEFLANSSCSRHLDKNVSVSNGFETLV